MDLVDGHTAYALRHRTAVAPALAEIMIAKEIKDPSYLPPIWSRRTPWLEIYIYIRCPIQIKHVLTSDSPVFSFAKLPASSQMMVTNLDGGFAHWKRRQIPNDENYMLSGSIQSTLMWTRDSQYIRYAEVSKGTYRLRKYTNFAILRRLFHMYRT